MILEFSTKLDSDELYCVTKTATYCLSVLNCSFFFLSNGNRFLGSFWSQCFQTFCTPSGRKGVFCKLKKMLKFILPFLSIFSSVTPLQHIWDIFRQFSQQLLDLGL